MKANFIKPLALFLVVSTMLTGCGAKAPVSTEGQVDTDPNIEVKELDDPWVYKNELSEVADETGLSVPAATVFALGDKTFTKSHVAYIPNDVLEIQYHENGGDETVTYRQTFRRAERDISGNSSDMTVFQQLSILDKLMVDVKGNDEGIMTVSWEQDGHTCNIDFSSPFPAAEVHEFLDVYLKEMVVPAETFEERIANEAVNEEVSEEVTTEEGAELVDPEVTEEIPEEVSEDTTVEEPVAEGVTETPTDGDN